MEDYVDLNTEQYRKFSAYVMQFNSTNDNKIDYETLFTKKQSFKIRLLNKNKSFMDKILLDMG